MLSPYSRDGYVCLSFRNVCFSFPREYLLDLSLTFSETHTNALLKKTKPYTTLNTLGWRSTGPVWLLITVLEEASWAYTLVLDWYFVSPPKYSPSKIRPRVLGKNACTGTTPPHRRVSSWFLKLSTNTRDYLYVATELDIQQRAASFWFHVCPDICSAGVTTVTTNSYPLLPKCSLLLNIYLLPQSLENTPTRREDHQGAEVQTII